MIHHGDALAVLRTLPDASVQCCVTSPPYYGLRDYGVDGQIGMEKTPEEFIARLVDVFSEVRRVLKPDGTLWVNIGDSYNAYNGNRGASKSFQSATEGAMPRLPSGAGLTVRTLKNKDLIGIPWMLAFALRQPYIDWRIKSEAMRAWVAGIVDGEGCITILKTKSSHSDSLSFPPIVQVRMTDTDPLQRLVEVAGSKYSAPQSPPSRSGKQRDSYQWKVVSSAAAQIIAEIYPFLTCKRKQAVVAYNHQLFRSNRGNQERRGGDIERELFCKDLIQKLNRREPVDLPSWMVKPKVKETPGWYLRQDCIWHKPNPMPESVQDRCTKAHEYVFLFSKSQRYKWDTEAMKEAAYDTGRENGREGRDEDGRARPPGSRPRTLARIDYSQLGRNRRSVWTLATMPTPEAHFATFPLELPELCIKASTGPGDTVLDPFAGAGTTWLACLKHGREFVGIELNPEYVGIAESRARKHYPLMVGAI